MEEYNNIHECIADLEKQGYCIKVIQHFTFDEFEIILRYGYHAVSSVILYDHFLNNCFTQAKILNTIMEMKKSLDCLTGEDWR